jgi:hypothetical protein
MKFIDYPDISSGGLTPHPAPVGRHPLPQGERVRCCTLYIQISKPYRAAPYPLPRHIRLRIWHLCIAGSPRRACAGEGPGEGAFASGRRNNGVIT